jgi:hypothetical protein
MMTVIKLKLSVPRTSGSSANVHPTAYFYFFIISKYHFKVLNYCSIWEQVAPKKYKDIWYYITTQYSDSHKLKKTAFKKGDTCATKAQNMVQENVKHIGL